MNPQQEKLQKLINDSPILSVMERAEWRALLGVMNDKQLLELERILTPAQPKAPAPVPQVQKPQVQVPKLSHILNMPHLGSGELELQKQNVKKPQAGEQAFSQKLHSILEEKELTAPVAQKDLPKTAEAPKPQTVIIQPVIVQKNTPPPAISPKPSAPQLDKELKQAIGKILEKKEIKTEPQFSAGINLGNASQKNQVDTLTSIKEHIEQRQKNFGQKIPPVAMPKRQLGLDPKISSLEDLSAIKPSILQETELTALMSKIKSLIASHGYYPVVFNLEKSPAYKTYIQTGANLLGTESDFSRSDGLEKYLSREEFEKMADLLRGIQMG